MFLELHLLQNFAPSNLNRDDTGAPKECTFGGHRRARISSQCLKRAVRLRFAQLLPDLERALRTKRAVLEVIVPGLERRGHAPEAARRVAERALGAVSLKLDEQARTQYLLFLAQSELEALVETCHRHFNLLAEEPAQSGQQTKKTARAGVPDQVRARVEVLLDGGKAADLALFGRMLADLPAANIDAAAQVAHAISTHRVSPEFDYYTAIDDLNPKEQLGAGMIGLVEFNSACYYRYANLDLEQLRANLKGDGALARRSAEGFLRASLEAVPSGKQHGSAAQNPPSFVMAVVRGAGLWSLANAFLDPVVAAQGSDLISKSIERLAAHWNGLVRMYGADSIAAAWFASIDGRELAGLGQPLRRVDDLIARSLAAVKFSARG
ncbi:MAG TPA: type I-E CRISPR-associated protein Cas7/Cse4/CasC [Candidatus Binataceae bacterium]|nr:type I-E CRISPR-associated protein Cas7/Cse4/CasC [Candidatus Binataceae bacterium]